MEFDEMMGIAISSAREASEDNTMPETTNMSDQAKAEEDVPVDNHVEAEETKDASENEPPQAQEKNNHGNDDSNENQASCENNSNDEQNKQQSSTSSIKPTIDRAQFDPATADDWYRQQCQNHLTTSQQREELTAMQLRFSFSDQALGPIWYTLHRSAGWIFGASRGKYWPPDVDYDSSIHSEDQWLTFQQMTAGLDYYSLAANNNNTIGLSTLQHPTSRTGGSSRKRDQLLPPNIDQEEERWRNLRQSAVYHHYKTLLNKQNRSQPPSNKTDSTTTTSRGGSQRLQEMQKEERSRRQRRQSQQLHQEESATTADKGAKMYLTKNANKAKHTRRKSGDNTNARTAVSDDTELRPFQLLDLAECASAVDDWLAAANDEHAAVEEREGNYAFDFFAEWRFLLSTNHSLLLYGVGSKRQLLQNFANDELSKEGYAVVVDSCDPQVTMDAILDLLVALFLNHKEPKPLTRCLPGHQDDQVVVVSSSIQNAKQKKKKKQPHFLKPRTVIRDGMERAKAVARALARAQAKDRHVIFLCIHNLEGLRNRQAQDMLATLVSNSQVAASGGVHAVRLVASVDHVDASALLWSSQAAAQFAWMWKQVNTYRPYREELVLLESEEIHLTNSKKRKSSNASARRKSAWLIDGEGADRVMEVLRNLATRYTEVIQTLASLQLEASSSNSKELAWIEESRLLQLCLKTCTVKSDSQLKNYLKELVEHELVVLHQKGTSAVMLRIPYTDPKLHEILAYKPDKQ